jgi:hypothetical protein
MKLIQRKRHQFRMLFIDMIKIAQVNHMSKKSCLYFSLPPFSNVFNTSSSIGTIDLTELSRLATDLGAYPPLTEEELHEARIQVSILIHAQKLLLLNEPMQYIHFLLA